MDPVKDNFLTIGLVANSSPISEALPVMTFRVPFGKPASSANAAKAKAEKGVWLAGFITTGQPTARAGAHFLVIIAFGKFQGVIEATTPTGCFNTTILRSVIGSGIVSPYTLFASSENHSIKEAPYPISPLDSFIGLPCSIVMIWASSSLFLIIKSNHLRKTSDLWRADFDFQSGQALFAASIAFFVSDVPHLGTVPISLRLAGLFTEIVSPESDAIHSPSI